MAQEVGPSGRPPKRICSITLTDSFLVTKTGTGHGEGKLYVGSARANRGFWSRRPRCMFHSDDLLRYMEEARAEYDCPQQEYRTDIRGKWGERLGLLKQLGRGNIEFTVRKVDVGSDRYYITSDDQAWSVFRTLMLPSISYLSILRHSGRGGLPLYLFRPFLDGDFGSKAGRVRGDAEERRIAGDTRISGRHRTQLVRARVGQGRFRSDLFAGSPMCVVTSIDDPSVLVASHIKPWATAGNREKLDPCNGLVLTPTFDKLFDRGMITFERTGASRARILVSRHLSDENQGKLGIREGRRFPIPDMNAREKYMKYHREEIFKP